MTGRRPPYGGNPDDPTQMGRTHNLGDRTQNLGDQTMRADASDFATQQAPDYAWSHEDPAAGQPAPYMGCCPYCGCRYCGAPYCGCGDPYWGDG